MDIYIGDVLEWADKYDGPKFHGGIADPPYHLSGGFMGAAWDKGEIAFDPATWDAIAKHLLPGAFMLVFSGSYNSHLVASAMDVRNGGSYIIHPMIAWVNGQGMGLGRKIDGQPGYRYGRQSLKPAVEPIIVAQVPMDGTYENNFNKNGTGLINVDGAAIGDDERTNRAAGNKPGGSSYNLSAKGMPQDVPPTKRIGRYPANVALDISAAQEINDDVGSDVAQYFYVSQQPYQSVIAEKINSVFPAMYCGKASRTERDSDLDDMPTVVVGTYNGQIRGTMHYRPQHGKNPHPTVKPLDLDRWLATLILPPESVGERRFLNPFSGTGTEMRGAVDAGWDSVVGIEQDARYASIAIAKMKGNVGNVYTI